MYTKDRMQFVPFILTVEISVLFWCAFMDEVFFEFIWQYLTVQRRGGRSLMLAWKAFHWIPLSLLNSFWVLMNQPRRKAVHSLTLALEVTWFVNNNTETFTQHFHWYSEIFHCLWLKVRWHNEIFHCLRLMVRWQWDFPKLKTNGEETTNFSKV